MPKRSTEENRPAKDAAGVSCQFPSLGEVTQIRRCLRAWYRRHGRRFPWRETHDPYAIWVSEVMLQQTTTTVVEKYFKRFLKRFPTVYHLARAKEEDVLRLWEGLGYYRRARHLHESAKIIVSQYGGVVPDSVEHLRRLPASDVIRPGPLYLWRTTAQHRSLRPTHGGFLPVGWAWTAPGMILPGTPFFGSSRSISYRTVNPRLSTKP